MRLRRDDERGSLMVLAGITLTLGFIVASFTLSQISTLEKEAAAEKPSHIASEWLFMHEKLESNLNTAISTSTTEAAFEDDVFQRVSATFRNLHEERGYDAVLRLAGSNLDDNEETELTNGPLYWDAYTPDGTLTTSQQRTIAYNGINDGILWEEPCPDPDGPASGCIVGVYLFVRLSDPSGSMQETILFDVS